MNAWMAPSFSALDVERIDASEYIGAVGLVILLWDHALTFADEVRLIWTAPLSIPKILFLFNRYMVPLAMIVQTHEFSGTATYVSLPICKVRYACAVAVGMLSIASSNFLVLLRLWVLWDRSPRLMMATFTVFIATQLAAMSLACYVIYDMFPTIFFSSLLRICMPGVKPKFVLLWSPGMAFECMVFLATVWNALDRPRMCDSEMAKIMYRDGSLYFFGLFALRLVNLVLAAVAPLSLVFMGIFFVWSVVNVTLTRLILNLRRLSVDGGMQDHEHGVEEDCAGLPVLYMHMHVRDSIATSGDKVML